jgi:exportin-2 (importin alpha re-exporter)
VDVMMHSSNNNMDKITTQLVECIAIMGRKYLQSQWPQLFPKLIHYLT